MRTSIDWTDEAAVQVDLEDEFRPKMAMWNATFNMPYHVFRARLSEIARSNLAAVERAVVTTLDETPEGGIIVPVDDDDWFAPHLAGPLLEAFEPDTKGVYWKRAILEARPPGNPFRALFGKARGSRLTADWGDGRFTCGTNNYALIREGDPFDLVDSHARASEFFDAHSAVIRRLPLALSMQNRNISSQTVLGWRRPSIPRSTLLRRFGRYRRLYRRLKLPSELDWAAPYVKEMARLMDDLRRG